MQEGTASELARGRTWRSCHKNIGAHVPLPRTKFAQTGHHTSRATTSCVEAQLATGAALGERKECRRGNRTVMLQTGDSTCDLKMFFELTVRLRRSPLSSGER